MFKKFLFILVLVGFFPTVGHSELDLKKCTINFNAKVDLKGPHAIRISTLEETVKNRLGIKKMLQIVTLNPLQGLHAAGKIRSYYYSPKKCNLKRQVQIKGNML